MRSIFTVKALTCHAISTFSDRFSFRVLIVRNVTFAGAYLSGPHHSTTKHVRAQINATPFGQSKGSKGRVV